jgi:transaldolase
MHAQTIATPAATGPAEINLEALHPLQRLAVKIFADGADRLSMVKLYESPLIAGMTTNPTLMRKAGISDYEAFARDILRVVTDKPISFEVFSDEPAEMRRQAMRIASWASNVYVKIPVTNTRGESMTSLVKSLAEEGIKLNVTAILTLEQVRLVAPALSESVPAVVSVFAGRIADTGRDPEPLMCASKRLLEKRPLAELLWASVREILNIFQADRCGCHIVTVPHEILTKALKMAGSDLASVSLDTVRMFAADAATAGFTL